jgi:hypothetical protein
MRETYEISGLSIASGVLAGNVGSNLHICPLGSGTCAIDHTAVRTGTITVDLMKSHHDHSALRDLRHVSTVRSEHLRNLSGWVIGSAPQSLSASIGCGVLEPGGVLLIWVTLGSVTGGGGYN